ncbi:uncharacterized protein LOC9655806 [Selaginella moellendorffii]|uniref:uncharacterized protein LOC9655806 n=1 Tax=Selaginella moellendorffii TaxID=88036 RepID=UPI000D1C7D4F|nr:uncharacterized protein LOC9655806 [Selaginella moellendorffii]|eukprot:XP_024541666.1 uncharacterized protein LOC9655806 [Selaginella moellendorffii]
MGNLTMRGMMSEELPTWQSLEKSEPSPRKSWWAGKFPRSPRTPKPPKSSKVPGASSAVDPGDSKLLETSQHPGPSTPPGSIGKSPKKSKSPKKKQQQPATTGSPRHSTRGHESTPNGTSSMWFTLSILAALLLLFITVFFLVIILVDARARLPSIALQGGEIHQLDPVCGDSLSQLLHISMAFSLNASSAYSVNFNFPPGKLSVAYKMNSTVAYDISDGQTPRFSVGGGNQYERFTVVCNSTVEVPQNVVKDLQNERAGLMTQRVYLHGMLRAKYRASPLLSNFKRRIYFCQNLTIGFTPGSGTVDCPNFTPSLVKHGDCHN